MNPTKFYVRTLMKPDTNHNPVECHGYVYGNLESAMERREGDDDESRLRRVEFEPIDGEARYRLALTCFAPASVNVGELILLRWLNETGKATAAEERRLARRIRAYRRALRAMALPSSYVELSPQTYVQMDSAPDEPLRSRADGLAAVARINNETVQAMGERSKGIYCTWALLIEIGKPLPFPHMDAIGISSGSRIGSLECSTVRPVRIVEPTAIELAEYRIDWTAAKRAVT